jgi:hypothetical protein
VDKDLANNLERVEGLLRAAKGALARNPDEAQRLLWQAQALARESISGGSEITLPGTLKGLARHRPHGPGYWREQA